MFFKRKFFKRKRDQEFTKDGRGAEITIDLILQARTQVWDNEVNGPEDAVVSDMIKQLPQEKIYIIRKCFQERFMGQTEAPSSWKVVNLVFLRKPDAEPQKGIRNYKAVALNVGDVEVGTHRVPSSSGKRTTTRKLEEVTCGRNRWHQLSTPSSDDDLAVAETLGVARGRE